ncbi:MAG: glycosyltransferase family 4 protein, partial [Phycisphaerae bacterium]|nr:glycosyltransferase family 4 protein [Phycisphaerae bacterium]
ALGVPVVVTSHGGDIGLVGRYRRNWITRRRMIRAMRIADAVTGVSEGQKALVDELTDGAAHSLVIPNGVDLDVVPPGEPGRLAVLRDRPFMLTLGRLHPCKGLDLLLSAIAVLRGRTGSRGERESGSPRIPHLVIAGDGNIRDALASQAKALGLTEAVTFAGAVFDEAKNWLLANCQFLVHPSRQEGFGLAILESMAAGKAVIGSDLPGIRQLINPGVTGLLTPVGAADGLADAIARLAGDPGEASRLGLAGLAAAGNYAWPRVAKQYLDLYQRCIDSYPAPPARIAD